MKLLIKKLGSCIDKSRPYYESAERARLARLECQTAAAEFRKANGLYSSILNKNEFFFFLRISMVMDRGFVIICTEIHAAAKETVALAEERFMSNTHNWPFDNAWQEMLNHATHKVSKFSIYF